MQRYYYHQHGTTLRGLVDEDGVAPEPFLDFVHDIDRSGLAPNPALAEEIARLPGRKLIFTNGSRNHALATVEQLGLGGLFEDAFDIVAAGLVPKPRDEAYDAFFRAHGVDPAHAAMFEDIAKNLAVPRARGMTTVLVTGKPGGIDHRQPAGPRTGAGFRRFRHRRPRGLPSARQRRVGAQALTPPPLGDRHGQRHRQTERRAERAEGAEIALHHFEPAVGQRRQRRKRAVSDGDDLGAARPGGFRRAKGLAANRARN